MRRLLSRSRVAWTIAIVQVVLLVQAVAFWAWTGFWFAAEFAVPGSAAFALVGALVASQRRSNRLGWLLLLMPIPGLLAFLGSEYTELARVWHTTLPLQSLVGWVSEWIWTPSIGIAVTMLIVRFPDGRVPHRWRFVDLGAIAGTVVFAGAIAWIAWPGGDQQSTPARVLLVCLGLGLIATAVVAALISLSWRYKAGDRELRLQMKWMLLATLVLTLALVVATVLEVAFYSKLAWILAPVYAALLCVPLAIGVAILRHRLFDIDLIISRTLVYVVVTGILGGLYIGVIELMQQVSILYTGQRSETAIVLTAFVVAGAFTPVQKWIDGVIERRFRRGDAAGRLLSVSASAESVMRVIEPHRFAQWLLDESVGAFEAEGGVLYLYRYHQTRPFHSRGRVPGDSSLEIPVRHGEQKLGRLVLGRRRGGVDYSHRDVEALKRSAAALGSALALATDLGHVEPAIVRAAASAGGETGARSTTRPVSV
jgi:hypothetical protein